MLLINTILLKYTQYIEHSQYIKYGNIAVRGDKSDILSTAIYYYEREKYNRI